MPLTKMATREDPRPSHRSRPMGWADLEVGSGAYRKSIPPLDRPGGPGCCEGGGGRRFWAMRLDPRLGGAAALRLLLAAHVVAAFEPITVGIAIGASALTGYMSYKDLYCRFAECCRSERPLNASGTAGLPWRGSRGAGDRPLAGISAPTPRALTLGWGRRRIGVSVRLPSRSRVFGEILRIVEVTQLPPSKSLQFLGGQ